MSRRVFRPIAGIVSVLLLASTPMHADPVLMSDVIQIIGNYQNSSALGLRTFSHAVDGSKKTPETGDFANSLLAVAVSSYDPQTGVHTIHQGDVEATICDCGEILVAGGGLPKWPLLFLTAIPFFFTGEDSDIDTPISTPTLPSPTLVTPQQIPIPEPASLLLFGSALAAFGTVLRRRYARMKLAAQGDTTDEGQST